MLAKSLRPLFSARVPVRAFFSTSKNAQEGPADASEPVVEPQQAVKDTPAIKLTEFAEEDFKPARLAYKTLLKSLEPYKQHNQKTYERLSGEVESLYRDKDAIPSMRMEIKAMEDVNKQNHEKLAKAVERIKASDQEALDIEARLSKEIAKSKTYAISKFSGEVLEILDNLELCMENAAKNKDKNKAVLESDFYQGVEMTYNHALNLFQRFGIAQIQEGVGSKADPNIHDVLFVAQDPSKAEGEILHVAKRGYRLGDRVLRASKVGVVRNE